MTTETPPMTAEQAENRLREIAPAPEWGSGATAEGTARYFAACAMLGFTRNVTPFIKPDQEISPALVCAQFAAAFSLLALIGTGREDQVAREVVDSWCDGNGMGTWLHRTLRHLSVDPDELARLDGIRLALENADREPAAAVTAGTAPTIKAAKTPAQEQADRILAAALDEVAEAYGVPARVSTDWCIAWGGEDANDCAGRLEYDDEAEADEMRQWIDGGIVARQTVIRLPWQTVPAGDGPAGSAEPAAAQAPEAEHDTFQKQASRYFRAAYGPDYLYQPPESFGLLERWIWAIGADEEKFAEQVMAELERAIAEHRSHAEEPVPDVPAGGAQ